MMESNANALVCAVLLVSGGIACSIHERTLEYESSGGGGAAAGRGGNGSAAASGAGGQSGGGSSAGGNGAEGGQPSGDTGGNTTNTGGTSDESGGGAGAGGVTGGAGGTSAVGGTSGAGGTSAVGGTSGVTCGEVVDPDPTLVQSCILAASCDPFVPDRYTISNCITYSDFEVPCLLGALDCGEVEACLGRRWEDASLCSSTEGEWHCEGNRAINCSQQHFPYSSDCARAGATCSEPSGGTGDLTEAPCEIVEVASCDDPEGARVCWGTAAYTCVDGHAYGVYCDAFDESCKQTAEEQAYCTDRTECDDDLDRGVVFCQGDAVAVCDDSGLFGAYDCARGGGTCEVSGTMSGYCLAPGCTTVDSDACREGCSADQSSLELCVGGAAYTVRCSDYGFELCWEDRDSLTGKSYAFCVGSAGVPCTDSCDFAEDEACDDGGPDSQYTVCAFGTDCTDCGQRRCFPSQIGGECQLPACGCAEGERCYPDPDARSMVCVPSTDELPEGAACAETGDCLTGLGCFGGTCKRYCTTVSDCAAVEGQSCLQTTWAEDGTSIDGVMVCVLPPA